MGHFFRSMLSFGLMEKKKTHNKITTQIDLINGIRVDETFINTTKKRIYCLRGGNQYSGNYCAFGREKV